MPDLPLCHSRDYAGRVYMLRNYSLLLHSYPGRWQCLCILQMDDTRMCVRCLRTITSTYFETLLFHGFITTIAAAK